MSKRIKNDGGIVENRQQQLGCIYFYAHSRYVTGNHLRYGVFNSIFHKSNWDIHFSVIVQGLNWMHINRKNPNGRMSNFGYVASQKLLLNEVTHSICILVVQHFVLGCETSPFSLSNLMASPKRAMRITAAELAHLSG